MLLAMFCTLSFIIEVVPIVELRFILDAPEMSCDAKNDAKKNDTTKKTLIVNIELAISY